MVENWIKVFESGEEYQAALIVDLLERYDLHPVLFDRRDDEFLIGRAEVYVAPEEADQANRIIKANSEEEE